MLRTTMRRRYSVLCWFVGFIVFGAVAEGAVASDAFEWSLADAIRVAEKDSPAVLLADLSLEEARNAYEIARVNQVVQPSVVARQQGENAWQLARQNREVARQNLKMQVAEAYYEVLRTEMALELAQRALHQSEAQLESTIVRHDQGMLSDVDLLAAESQAATAALDLNRARAAVASARMDFNRLLGHDLEQPFILIDELEDDEGEPIALEDALAYALEHRVEVRRARNSVDIKEKELRVNDHEFTPPLTIKRLQLAYERARIELKEQELDVILEVRQRHQDVEEARARLPIQQKNVTRAQESQRIAEVRYDSGLITSVDLIDAQRAAFQAEMQYIQAIFDYQIALARLKRSAGLTLK